LLFFVLVSGDRFLRRVVNIVPRFQDERQAVNISQQIAHDLSAYIVTIAAMNAT
jgi:predicted PurR-regulated permease PerM